MVDLLPIRLKSSQFSKRHIKFLSGFSFLIVVGLLCPDPFIAQYGFDATIDIVSKTSDLLIRFVLIYFLLQQKIIMILLCGYGC